MMMLLASPVQLSEGLRTVPFFPQQLQINRSFFFVKHCLVSWKLKQQGKELHFLFLLSKNPDIYFKLKLIEFVEKKSNCVNFKSLNHILSLYLSQILSLNHIGKMESDTHWILAKTDRYTANNEYWLVDRQSVCPEQCSRRPQVTCGCIWVLSSQPSTSRW